MTKTKEIIKSEKLGVLWRAAHNFLNKRTRRTNLAKSCQEISKLLEFDDYIASHRVSLRSAAILIHGAAVIHSLQATDLLKDVRKLDEKLRDRERERQEQIETEVRPTTPEPEPRPLSPILPGPSQKWLHARATQIHSNRQDNIRATLNRPSNPSSSGSTQQHIQQEVRPPTPEPEPHPHSSILPGPSQKSVHAKTTQIHSNRQDIIRATLNPPSNPSSSGSTQQYTQQEIRPPTPEPEPRPISPIPGPSHQWLHERITEIRSNREIAEQIIRETCIPPSDSSSSGSTHIEEQDISDINDECTEEQDILSFIYFFSFLSILYNTYKM